MAGTKTNPGSYFKSIASKASDEFGAQFWEMRSAFDGIAEAIKRLPTNQVLRVDLGSIQETISSADSETRRLFNACLLDAMGDLSEITFETDAPCLYFRHWTRAEKLRGKAERAARALMARLSAAVC